ncbi:MAG: FeoB-associated Cys-rich membrane protein [Acutalibacteraceae bacterium]|nr:FeoB-associated Cys-rich membrane protein [Acutalibacteraceae bacterium]
MLPTIIIASLIALTVIAIIVNEIVKKKKGKGGCSCGCSGCAMKENCHNKE